MTEVDDASPAGMSNSDSSDMDDLSADEGVHSEADGEGPETEDGAPARKRARTAELRRPPTAEELVNLRQTQSLFHSSLFQLQTTEMLTEVRDWGGGA